MARDSGAGINGWQVREGGGTPKPGVEENASCLGKISISGDWRLIDGKEDRECRRGKKREHRLGKLWRVY